MEDLRNLVVRDEVESVVDKLIFDMLDKASATIKAQRVNEDYEKVLANMDLSRPEGLGLGAELTHGRLVSSMSPADKILHRSLKQGAQKNRREDLDAIRQKKAKQAKETAAEEREPTKGSQGRKVKIQKKLQLDVKRRRSSEPKGAPASKKQKQ